MAAPKLRFKEFDNDWINTKVKDLGEFSSGGTPSKDIHDYWNGNIPWISSSDLNEESIFDIRINRFISEDAIKNSATKKIPKNSILLVSRVGVGKVALTNQELCTSQDFTALTPKKDYALFIAYLMKNITPRLLDLNQGTSIKGFVREDLISLPISLPSKAEQKKIATFLSAVDEKISQLSQKLHLLGQYKQGMMQKLFSQQIRFKADDGSEFEEWEEKQLGDVCHFINGRAYKQTEWEKEGTPVIRLQNLTGSGKEYYYSTLNLPDHQYCYNNDLLYMWSATFGPIFWQGEKAIFHYHIWKVEVEPQQLDKQYMYYLLDEMTEKMKSSLNGSTMLHVTKQGMESTKKNLPSIEEQTKIANFLSAMDQKIEIAAQQIEQAKQWKKGLLQQMFV